LTCDEISSLYYSLCNPYYISRYTFLKNIDTIIFPSEYIKNVFISFTSIPSEINIIKSYHPDIDYISPNIITNILNKPEFKIVIIGFNKGYKEIINFITNYKNPNIKIIVLGSKISHPSIQVYLEKYDDLDIERIFHEIKPNLIWFPSKVPETYCYALSHSIKLGYPIVAYNIGAFTERLFRRPATWLLDLSDSLENNIDEIISSYQDKIISCVDYIKLYNYISPKDYFNYFV
jgi:predicted secreted protein